MVSLRNATSGPSVTVQRIVYFKFLNAYHMIRMPNGRLNMMMMMLLLLAGVLIALLKIATVPKYTRIRLNFSSPTEDEFCLEISISLGFNSTVNVEENSNKMVGQNKIMKNGIVGQRLGSWLNSISKMQIFL